MLSHGNQTDFIIDGIYDNARSQQRQRIRDAYNARLTEDGISEYE